MSGRRARRGVSVSLPQRGLSARPACGFILLPVVLALTLVAAVAFLLNRSGGMNMNLAARGFETDSARYVAEAGLAQIIAQTQARDCSGYTDSGTTAFGPNSFTATVNPKSGSPVTLTAMGTTARGAVATRTRTNVIVHSTTPYSVTLQPGVSLQDAHIESASPAMNYGATAQFKVSGNGQYPLLRFDLASIPANTLVQSAQLSLYKTGGGSGPAGATLTAYPLTRAWTEGTLNGGSPPNGVTWNTADGAILWTTPGGDYDSTRGAVTLSTGSNSVWLSWDLTSLVQNWVDGASINNGVVLIPSAGVPGQDYLSGDNPSDVPNTPKLTVSFLTPCGWTPPPSVDTLNPYADAMLNEANDQTNYGGSTVLGLKAGDGSKKRVIASFDTSGIAPGTLISSATLRLYVASTTAPVGSTKTVQAFRVTEAWVEGTKTGSGTANGVSWKRKDASENWDADGGSYASSAAGAATLADTFTSGWITLDITALVQSWIDGVSPNYGVIVTLSTSETFNINSRQNAANRPELVLTF